MGRLRRAERLWGFGFRGVWSIEVVVEVEFEDQRGLELSKGLQYVVRVCIEIFRLV